MARRSCRLSLLLQHRDCCPGGSNQRSRRIERDSNTNAFEHRAQATLVEKGLDKSAPLQERQNLWCDAAAYIDPADSEIFQCEIGRFGAINRCEDLERLHATQVLSRERALADHRRGILRAHPNRQPVGLCAGTARDHEAINIVQARAGQHALEADVIEFAREELEQTALLVATRRKIAVAA